MNQEEIRKQAKALMDDFSASLARVKFKEEKVKKPVGGFREEGAGLECDSEFRKAFFANAPRKEGDFIIAEKKQW